MWKRSRHGAAASRLSLALLLGAVAPIPKARAAETGLSFELPDPRTGSTVSLSPLLDRGPVVVIFIGTECRLTQRYLPVIAELKNRYAPRGVQFVAIDANVQDEPDAVSAHAKKNSLAFPVLKDADQTVAERFGATRTPEAFLLDRKGAVVYQGRIDDRFGFGFQRPKARTTELNDAIESLLSGRPIRVARAAAIGCAIGRARPPKAAPRATFRRDVAPIIARHCQGCHQPGQIGPMSLLGFKDVRNWSETIKDVVSAGRMPPWFADPRFGTFTNANRLSDEEKTVLLTWIDDGCPEGQGSLPPRPPPVSDGTWKMGKPDLVYTMETEFVVPVSAPPPIGVPYQYFVIPMNLKEPVWIKAIEAKPGNPEVVHHLTVGIQYPGESETGSARAWRHRLGGFASGHGPYFYPPGVAKRIPAGSSLVFQVHYVTIGREVSDRSSIGLLVSKTPPESAAVTIWPSNTTFRIPPGAENHEVSAWYQFERPARILSLSPHMHFRGKDFRFDALDRDGKRNTWLSVLGYDFNWQLEYLLTEQLEVSPGTKVQCIAHFDNSSQNPNNPDPSKEARWGDQSWDEMMMGLIEVAVKNTSSQDLDAFEERLWTQLTTPQGHGCSHGWW